MARTFGNYELVELLGRGGMGEVWRGQHRMLQRDAAIKLISPAVMGSAGGAADPDTLRRRFEREAKATSALTSPHTVDLFDYGLADDGTFFYAMELLDGVDLQTLVERTGPLPPARAVHLLRQIGESLGEAHHRGLVHRDVKPGNVFACRIGLNVDFVKVLDFGLVRAVTEAEDDTQLTAEGVAAGSPAYMAPEVIRSHRDVDHRADVYAFGGLAVWLMSGELLFPSRSSLQMVLGHLEQEPKPLRARAVDVPEELDGLVMSCLAKERAARPTDLRALCRAMTATLEGGWSDEASERWWGEHNPGRSWMGAIEQPDPPSGGGTELATGVGQADEGQADHGRVISVEFQTAPMDPGELREARKETIEALKSHFAASHIDFDVFDARSSDALRANDRRDLDRLVADLPKPRVQGDVGRAVPMAAPTREVTTDDYEELPTEDLPIPAGQELPARSAESQLPALVRKDRFVSVFSSTKRLGEWAPAHKTRCVSVFGETKLDLREARLPAGPTDIHCVSVFGATKIIVPPDLFVQADGAAIVGEFSDYSHSVAPPGEGEPWLRVTGIAVLGEVSIKVKKRDGEGLLAKAFKTLVGLAAPTERKRLPAPEEPERDD